MIKCGIKRYDELPTQVGEFDVDVIRQYLCYLNRDSAYLMERLEFARKQWLKTISKKQKQ